MVDAISLALNETDREVQKRWPIVYRDEYNVRFCGLEKFHPFDASKWYNVFQRLKVYMPIDESNIYCPEEITEQGLLQVHTERYLNSLKWSYKVAGITEIPILAFVPNCLVQKWYLQAMRYQVGGSLLAGQLALQKGWAINIGGGFHHCSRHSGGGFCPYADITLLIMHMFENYSSRVRNVMIVDLDAHQGNGYENDFLADSRIFIFDVYNGEIYPRDENAKHAITCQIELNHYTSDNEYLYLVERNLEKCLSKFHPDLIIYNAGTDILEGDPLGKLSVSPEGIITRDKIVFMKARERRVPIVMLTSGGYLKQTADIIADSIINLISLELINL